MGLTGENGARWGQIEPNKGKCGQTDQTEPNRVKQVKWGKTEPNGAKHGQHKPNGAKQGNHPWVGGLASSYWQGTLLGMVGDHVCSTPPSGG